MARNPERQDTAPRLALADLARPGGPSPLPDGPMRDGWETFLEGLIDREQTKRLMEGFRGSLWPRPGVRVQMGVQSDAVPLHQVPETISPQVPWWDAMPGELVTPRDIERIEEIDRIRGILRDLSGGEERRG